MRLYLDVDGTLLRRGGHARLKGEMAPAEHLKDFLEWVTRAFDCVWLTSRNRSGGHGGIREVFRQAYGPGHDADAVDQLVTAIRPSVWATCKAEAIDFDEDFLWLDDAPEEPSLDLLQEHGAMDRWIAISVDRKPDDLVRIKQILGRRG
jgi:hypothetical protein